MTTSNIDEPLLYLAGATEGTTQWKAETLQLVNWGGFHGHTTVTFAPTATLLPGASGTGKSTLLDAYIALMMDSNIPFNGASNDATVGRARSSGQRSLVSYLRGKLDTSRDANGDLADQVLRGQDSATWGALAVTFIDDNKRRYTVARLYYVPRSATKDSDVARKMCTVEGTVDLRDVEPFAEGKFDKRAVENRFPNLKMHESYGAFSQAFFTRLGIGAHGDGAKALRLLARIQAGHQVRTVDDLYKSMVIERPGTYAAADAAVEHFKDLEDAYEAMATEEKKAEVLAKIPYLNEEREKALGDARLIDTFGIYQTMGDAPFELWKLNTEDILLEAAEDTNREQRARAEKDRAAAEVGQATLTDRKVAVEADLSKNESHATLARLDSEITQLGFALAAARTQRDRFDQLTARLNRTIETKDDYTAAQQQSRRFIDGFDAALEKVTERQEKLRDAAYEPSREKSELLDERESLSNREGRMDSRLHASRVIIAQATGIDPKNLPFVGELIDVLPEQKKWRKAIETTLLGPARVLLIDANELDRISRIIDPLELPHRVNYEGVDLAPYKPRNFNPSYVSGKLAYKDTPFTAWVQDRIVARNTDALCVDSANDLGHGGRRVTVNGQTRQGRSGAHGDINAPYVIGFSKEERLTEIKSRLHELETTLSDLDRQRGAAKAEFDGLLATKSAHEHILVTTWRGIDPNGIQAEIDVLEKQKQRILDSDDVLRELREELDDLSEKLKKAGGEIYAAEGWLRALRAERDEIIERKDHVVGEIERIGREQVVTLTDKQTAYLDTEFAQVATVGDRGGFKAGADRLKSRLIELGKGARDKANQAARALEAAFQRYLDNWDDPNLSASVENYPSFRRILEKILATGLHERRQEWTKRLTDWSGQDLVPLAGAFSLAIDDIRDRLDPVNAILAKLPFGANRDRLKIDLRELQRDDIAKFKRELNILSRADTGDFSEEQIQNWFKRLRRFMGVIRNHTAGKNNRDYYLDVRKHIEITAVSYDSQDRERSTYAALGGKSGGESQELVAFIVGAALRFQLGDEANARPRFAPVFLDEGFVKADSEFAGRSIDAWKGLGFQLIIGAPYDKFTALEPHADHILYMAKSRKGYSSVKPLARTERRAKEQVNVTEVST